MPTDDERMRASIDAGRAQGVADRQAEKDHAAAFHQAISDARSGKVAPTGWTRTITPLDRYLHEVGVTGLRDLPEAKAPGPRDRSHVGILGSTELQSEAWDSLDEATQIAVNAKDPAAEARYSEIYERLLDGQPEEAE